VVNKLRRAERRDYQFAGDSPDGKGAPHSAEEARQFCQAPAATWDFMPPDFEAIAMQGRISNP